MNKKQFLDELQQLLNQIPDQDRKDIVSDQEEFIREATQAGRSETEVLEKLGSPKDFAASIMAEYKFQKIHQARGVLPTLKAVMGSLGAFLILAPFNFFMLLGPILAAFVIFIVILSLGFSFVATGVAGALYYVTSLTGIGLSMAFGTMIVFGSLGFIGLGLMFLYLCSFTALLSIKQMTLFLEWNLNFIKKNRIQF